MNAQLRSRSVEVLATRSVLRTILSEYVLPEPGRLWQQTLVAALVANGYSVPAARQTVTRAVGSGWMTTERHGRSARLHVEASNAEFLVTTAPRILDFGEPWEWSGRWLVVAVQVPEERREVRHSVRSRLAWAGFGSLGNGMWITPHVEREDELRELMVERAVAEMLWFHSELGAPLDPSKVAAQAWDLDGVAAIYAAFIERFAELRPATPQDAFAARTMLVHEWRKFPFIDPDLPEALLPAGWPRSRARELFRRQHAAWRDDAEAYFAELEARHAPSGAT